MQQPPFRFGKLFFRVGLSRLWDKTGPGQTSTGSLEYYRTGVNVKHALLSYAHTERKAVSFGEFCKRMVKIADMTELSMECRTNACSVCLLIFLLLNTINRDYIMFLK